MLAFQLITTFIPLVASVYILALKAGFMNSVNFIFAVFKLAGLR